MKYLIGRDNLAATIYVPYDCGNNCPFCTSKEMYRNLVPNLDLLWANIRLINKTRGIKDVVLTGGEPFANLEILQKIIDKIAIDKKLFINTTLPFKSEEKRQEIKDFLNKNRNKITCLNISRHITHRTHNDTNDRFINALRVPFRINCVLYNMDEMTKEKTIEFIKRFPSAQGINFRADYRNITLANLKTLDHPFITFAVNELNAKYVSGGGCQVCNTDHFYVKLDERKYKFALHRGLEFSSLQVGNRVLVNDIILMPDSHMFHDWDKKRPQEEGKKMLDVLKDLGYEYRNNFVSRAERERRPSPGPINSCGYSLSGPCGGFNNSYRPVFRTCGGGC